jgi:S-adenosylmethionine synthetase
MRPYAIINRMGLKYPIFSPTASYGHFGRKPYSAEVKLNYGGVPSTRKVDFFSWEKLDYAETIRKAFAL